MMKKWFGVLLIAVLAAAIVAAWAPSSTKIVTVTRQVLLEDRDSDAGDKGGTRELSNHSLALGAANVVRIDPSAEKDSADLGGAKPKGLSLTNGVVSCGVERASVKHLTDGFVLPATPTVMTIDQLVNMAAPPVSTNSPRFPVEKQLVELRNVHVIAAKQEADSDLHIIISTATGGEMNVESPMAACDATSPYASLLAKARASADSVLGSVSSSSYTPENVTVTIVGTLFFDVLHGQRGAPNGVELHPLTFFGTGAAPPVTTTVTTTTTPTSTVVNTTTTPTTTTTPVVYNPLWPGCKRYPHRIYYKHVAHRYCRASYYITP